MINYTNFESFYQGSVDKQWKIEYEGGQITNEILFSQSIELTESLCSEPELRFGCCEASELKFKVGNTIQSLLGKWLTVSLVLDKNHKNPLIIGKYKVASDKVTADREHREIVAYDAMYDIINADVSDWYNAIFPNRETRVPLMMFRKSFIKHFGLEEVEPVVEILEGGTLVYGLVNDSIYLSKTIQVGEGMEIDNETEQASIPKESTLSGLDVIKAICEINGCFGHIGRDGKFHYIYLRQAIEGLYPEDDLYPDRAPDYLPYQQRTGHLYPQDPKTYRIGRSKYISCQWEDYISKSITKLQIRQEENDIGAQYPEGKIENENTYFIEDNFLVYGMDAKVLSEIAKNIFKKITNISYRSFNADVIGNPCLEIGDPVRFDTRYEIVESYIFKRTLKGVQALRDSYETSGTERYIEKVNSVGSSIIQLKGKTNILERNVDKTRLEMQEMGEGLSTEISVTAAEINETIKNTKEGLETRISKTVRSIEMSVSNDNTGKIAEVKLLVTDEGGTQYEVTADKIDFTGLVSFSNLEEDGETIINGRNIKTGEINCDLLNGGEIRGQKITGGEIAGATIKANEALYLQYTNTNTRPNISGEYIFAETGYENPSYGGIDNEEFLNIKSPKGTVAISIGRGLYKEDAIKNIKDVPFFPFGAMIKEAYIDSLYSYHYQGTKKIESVNDLTYHVRKSGVFASVYGKYSVHLHGKGRVFSVSLENYEKFAPTHHSVKTTGYFSGNSFLFNLGTDGTLDIRNLGDDIISSGDVQFRFDYFIF